MTALTLEYRKRWMQCRVPEKELSKIRTGIEALPGAMSGELHTLDIDDVKTTRHRNVWRLKIPPFRVIFQIVGRKIVVLELDRREKDTYKHIDRLAYTRVAEGIEIVEVPELEEREPARQVRGAPPARPAAAVEYQNPLTPFSAEELAAMGTDEATIALIRSAQDSVDIGETLAPRGLAPEVVELLGDAWFDPQKYLDIIASGRTPTVDDARIDDAELEQRLDSPDSSTSLARLAGDDLERVLAAPIEEWMFYLHPTQARIVRHEATGPSRVRGGPGSGKTVAALHRARHLVRQGQAEHVLLTTFVRVLPTTWRRLLQAFAPEEADAITTSTVDALARQIVAAQDGEPAILADEQQRVPLAEKALAASSLAGRTPQWLLTEFDTVIAGRALSTAAEYMRVSRVGRGSAVRPQERRQVWAAYEHFREQLQRNSAVDFPHLRLRALELAHLGHGPRFDAVVVDEAQDLTAAHIELLKALDADEAHRCFMLVGDGQQSIYPGGFSLRSVELDVRGRSFVLRTNWRNTQRISEAALDVLGDQDVRDLEAETGVARDDAPPRRLGDSPQLHLVGSRSAADLMAADIVREALSEMGPEEVAILGRKNKVVRDRAEAVCRTLSVPSVRLNDLPQRADGAPGCIRVGNFEYSKGLEFKFVLLVGPARGDWSVSPYWMSEQDDKVEWWRTERRKLFVAMTRARDRLAVVANEPLAAMLGDARNRFAEWDWTK